jgi:vesicle coat complex subunit
MPLQVLPPLFEAFKNPNADVRKAVVFCLVDMYMWDEGGTEKK